MSTQPSTTVGHRIATAVVKSFSEQYELGEQEVMDNLHAMIAHEVDSQMSAGHCEAVHVTAAGANATEQHGHEHGSDAVTPAPTENHATAPVKEKKKRTTKKKNAETPVTEGTVPVPATDAPPEPAKPPRGKSGYNIYVEMMMQRDEVKELEPKKRMTHIGKTWKDLTDDDRMDYNNKAKGMTAATSV
ncbi:MAG: HMG-box domain-containing protein [Sulfobacillus sp.]